jgi:hypothetical protein
MQASASSAAQVTAQRVRQSSAQAQTASGAIIQAEKIFQARAEAASQSGAQVSGAVRGVLVAFPSATTTGSSASGRIVWSTNVPAGAAWAPIPEGGDLWALLADEPDAGWTQLRA